MTMSPATPLVSVVIPTHNRADLLPQAIRSALDQTLTDLEVLVIDDASVDHTTEVLTNYQKADPRVRALKLSSGQGAPAARNLGIRTARGKYVAFLDDDDWWIADKLDRQIRAVESSPGVGAVLCPFVCVVGEREWIAGMQDVSVGNSRRALLKGNHCTGCLLARREVLEAVEGFDERLPRLQDLDLFLRLAQVTRWGFVPEPLLRVRSQGTDRISSNNAALRPACEILIKKHASEEGSRSERADVFYALGHILLARGMVQEGRQLLLRSLRLSPWPPQRLVMGALATIGDGPYWLGSRLHSSVVGRLQHRRTARGSGPATPRRLQQR